MKPIRKPKLGMALVLAAMVLTAPAMAEGGSRIFVPLGSVNSVMVLDTATDRSVATIRDLPEAHGLAITPDGQTLVAGSLMTGEAGAAPERPAGIAEEEHASHHGGDANAAVGKVSYLTVINASDGAIKRRIAVPGAVHHVTISPNGKVAAASHPGGGGISLVDLDKGVATAAVPTGPQPNYLAWSADGQRLYVSNSGDGTISELTLGHGIYSRKLRAGGTPEHLVLSADGSRLYVNDANGGAVVEVDTEAWAVARTFEIGGMLHGIDLSDDGKRLFVVARESNEIAVVDLTTGGIRRTKLGPEPYHLAVARNAGKIYVSSAAESKLWALDAATLATVAEIPIPGEGHQMAVH